MPGIATIQNALGNVDSCSCKVCFVVNVFDRVDRAAMNPHPHLDVRTILQGPANIERTSHRFFRGVKKEQGHPVSGRHANKFAICFSRSKTLGTAHDLIQVLEQLDLLIYQQFRVTDHVDQQDVRDFQGEIRCNLLGRVLRVHASRSLATDCPGVETKRAWRQRKAPPNAATLRTIITSAKRYIPIIKPIPACIAQMQLNQILRVLLLQMKKGYPISNTQINIPATGNRYFHLTKASGSITLNGGRISARHTLEPSHHPRPKHLARPLKKKIRNKRS